MIRTIQYTQNQSSVTWFSRHLNLRLYIVWSGSRGLTLSHAVYCQVPEASCYSTLYLAKCQRPHSIPTSILQSSAGLVLSQALSCQVPEAKFYPTFYLVKYKRTRTTHTLSCQVYQRPHAIAHSTLCCEVPQASFYPTLYPAMFQRPHIS